MIPGQTIPLETVQQTRLFEHQARHRYRSIGRRFVQTLVNDRDPREGNHQIRRMTKGRENSAMKSSPKTFERYFDGDNPDDCWGSASSRSEGCCTSEVTLEGRSDTYRHGHGTTTSAPAHTTFQSPRYNVWESNEFTRRKERRDEGHSKERRKTQEQEEDDTSCNGNMYQYDWEEMEDLLTQDGQQTSHKIQFKNYYYHEYHYMHYYYTHYKRTRRSTQAMHEQSSSSCNATHGGNVRETVSIKLAIEAYETAVSIASSDVNSSDEDIDSKQLEEMGAEIVLFVEQAAEYSGWDIITFAHVIGALDMRVLDTRARGTLKSLDVLRKKARRSIAASFHPDKLIGQPPLSYTLGQSIVTVMNSMHSSSTQDRFSDSSQD